MAQLVKNLPATQDILVRFLYWEDPLKEGMATYPSILTWRIPWTEEPSGGGEWGRGGVGSGGIVGVRSTIHRVAKSRLRLSTHAGWNKGFICLP